MATNSFQEREVVVIGLGYVGLTLAAHVSSLGISVLGIEVRDLVLNRLKSKQSFFYEPGLDKLLAQTLESGTFRYSSKLESSAIPRIFVITVGTPIDTQKIVLEESIIRVASEVSNVMNDNDLIILRSTVKLNTTREIIQPILDDSEKKYFLAFCPERTLEGAALQELGKLPQVIGGINEESTKQAAEFFSLITSTVVKVRNAETAELIKLVDNVQRDIKFAIANEIADICNSENIKASEVISLGKLGYPRTDLPFPGPVGGPCLEKDTYILAESLQKKSKFPSIAVAARQVNEEMINKVSDFVVMWFTKNQDSIDYPKVAILGMAFKGIPETNDLRGSPSLALFSQLKSKLLHSTDVALWDPVISLNEAAESGYVFTEDLPNALQGANCVILANNHPQITSFSLNDLANLSGRRVLIYDLWGRFDDLRKFPDNLEYSSWGSHGFLEEGNSI
jgi:nucleotide sugar dehydrogenase